jgi:hypothetical protein
VKPLALALLAMTGCATVDIYNYQPKPLPEGSQPLAIVEWSLQDLRDVSWSYGEADPDPSRHAVVAPYAHGLTAAPHEAMTTGSPLDLSYAEIVDGVRMVTELHGTWTIYIYDRHHRTVQMAFSSLAAARLFLDASAVLARS